MSISLNHKSGYVMCPLSSFNFPKQIMREAVFVLIYCCLLAILPIVSLVSNRWEFYVLGTGMALITNGASLETELSD